MDNSLVAAKTEYTQQLCGLLYPHLYTGFTMIWKDCKEEIKALKKFQEKICLVPKWNQDIIDDEYNRLIKNTDCAWLDKLIEAVFLSNVKVLSTIRIGQTKTINIKVPNTKNFIHKCYIETARKLWQDPYLIDDRDNLSHVEIKRNILRLNILISSCIEQTIRDLIPIQTILESYLNDLDPVPEMTEELFNDTTNDASSEVSEQEVIPDEVELKPEQSKRYEDFFMTDPDTNKLAIAEGESIEESLIKNETPDTNTKTVKIDSSPFFSDSDQE